MEVLVLGDNEMLGRCVPLFLKRKEANYMFASSKIINPITLCDDIILRYDLVISLHCKTIFPEKLVKSVRCINVHPGYLPFNRGVFPHVFSILNGKPAGVTIHEMTERIDDGPVIYQSKIEVFDDDTSESLYKRILDEEFILLSQYLDKLLSMDYETSRVIGGNYNSMDDFKRLCELDSSKVGTFKEFYDLLRALSHGDYKNAHIGNTYLKIQTHEHKNEISN